MMKQFALAGSVCAVLATSMMAGCNGGGDDNDSANTPIAPVATAEGFWIGTASPSGSTVNLAVLENGETWGVYSMGNTIVGALYGQTASSGGTSLSGTGKDFYFPTREVVSATYSGTFSPKASISVKTSAGGAFTGNYDTSYDQVATLTTIAGSFAGYGLTGDTATSAMSVGISSLGVITAVDQGCSVSGNVKPRTSGKNIFDVSTTFTGVGCALGNGATTTGIAVYSPATREMIVMALNTAKSNGFVYLGKKL